MAKFLCLQRSLPKSDTAPSASPAEMQDMYAAFGAWQQKFADQLVDMGGRLGAGQLVALSPPSDGPFIEVKELVGGYMIVEADTIEGAMEVARGCPGLVSNGSGCEVIEIRTQ